jgi:hypothetical protein
MGLDLKAWKEGWNSYFEERRRDASGSVSTFSHFCGRPINTSSYQYWGSEIESNPPSVHYDEIMADDKGVGQWTAKIVRRYQNN